MKPPRFWHEKNSFLASALRPLSAVYGRIVQKRLQTKDAYTSSLPVICVGNVTMGGSGKTPVVEAIVRVLKENGKNPAVLLRGYGGANKETLSVDLQRHTASLVGDEALLHARTAATIVSADRIKGAQAIEKDTWHTHIVMDDGLQNPSLKKTVSFLVVDSVDPFGNEEVFPAGPLREPIDEAAKRVDAIIAVGPRNDALEMRFSFLCPLFRAKIVPENGEEFTGKAVIAFAGIGRPQKFFDTLRAQDALIVEEHVFPDHHAYKKADIDRLIARAARCGASLVTTRKDWVRLMAEQRASIRVLDVCLQWEEKNAVAAFLKQKGVL